MFFYFWYVDLSIQIAGIELTSLVYLNYSQY